MKNEFGICMAQDDSARKFTFDVGWVFISSVVTFAVGIILNLLIGNYFDAEGLGAYSIVITIWTIGTLTAGIGIPIAIIKFVAEHQNEEDVKNQLISTALTIGVIIGCLVSFVLFLISPVLEGIFDIEDLAFYLSIISISFPFVVINEIFLGVFNATRKMKHFTLVEVLRRGLILISTVALILLGFGLTGAVLGLVIPPILVTLVLFAYHKKVFIFKVQNFKNSTKTLVKFGGQLYLGNGVGLINTQAAILLIGYYLTDPMTHDNFQVGVYAIALLIFNALVMLPGAIQKITYPAISTYLVEKKFHSIKSMMENTMRITFVLLSVLSLLVVFFVDDFIRLLLPGDVNFMLAVTPIRILMVMLIIYWAFVPVGAAFTSADRPDIGVWVSIIQAIVNISMCIILIPINFIILDFQIGGINGATLALGTSLQIGIIAFFIYCKRVMKIKPDMEFLVAGFFLFMGIISAGFILVYKLGFNGNLAGLILIPVYIASMFLLKIITVDTLKNIFSKITAKKA
jgi:O-antigen/teichoic acid export membrane protein